jgi:hypothetical protein
MKTEKKVTLGRHFSSRPGTVGLAHRPFRPGWPAPASVAGRALVVIARRARAAAAGEPNNEE